MMRFLWWKKKDKSTEPEEPLNDVANKREDINKELGRAALIGDNNTVESLILQGADVNLRDFYGSTPLIYGVKSGNVAIVEMLIKNGANVNAADSDGITPLMVAAKNNSPDILRLLLSHGADINAKINVYAQRTALIMAAISGNIEIVKILLENSADINARDKSGNTALFEAKVHNHQEIVEILEGITEQDDRMRLFGQKSSFELGVEYYRRFKLDEAIMAFTEAIDQDPKLESFKYRANCLINKAANIKLDEEKVNLYKNALSDLNKCREIGPNDQEIIEEIEDSFRIVRYEMRMINSKDKDTFTKYYIKDDIQLSDIEKLKELLYTANILTNDDIDDESLAIRQQPEVGQLEDICNKIYDYLKKDFSHENFIEAYFRWDYSKPYLLEIVGLYKSRIYEIKALSHIIARNGEDNFAFWYTKRNLDLI